MTSSITLCSTPVHTSVRRCFKSFTSCTWFVCRLVVISFVVSYSVGLWSGLFGGHISRISQGDYDLLDYSTVGVDAVNDAQTVWVNTACGKDHSQKNISNWINRNCSIAMYITESLQTSEETNNTVYKVTTVSNKINFWTLRFRMVV